MKRRILALLIIFILVFSISGCKKNEETESGLDEVNQSNEALIIEEGMYPVTVTDSSGREVTINNMPERIVSTVPSNTEIIYEIGKGSKLVGVSVYCNYPKEALEVEKIGDYNGTNIELVIGLNPDVVLGSWMPDDVVAQLEDSGIKVVLVNPEDLEQTYQVMLMIGDVVGASKEAEEMVSNLKAKQETIMNRVSGYDGKTVFYEIWNEPLMTVGPGSLHNELITLANGVNIAADTESSYPEYSLEMLIAKNPQVYLTGDDGFKTVEDIFEREGYVNIEAIKTGQLFMLNKDILSRPGPRIIEAFESVASAIHPEAFNGK